MQEAGIYPNKTEIAQDAYVTELSDIIVILNGNTYLIEKRQTNNLSNIMSGSSHVSSINFLHDIVQSSS